MITLGNPEELAILLREQRQQGHRIAFVPTMGNLHDGHISLVREASRLADFVVTSIYINPLQFGANEDLDKYPRTLEADQQKLQEAGNHLLFTPDSTAIYPEGLERHTKVIVPLLTEGLCGASRPGHFDGVTTVVNILFNMVQPDVALFGEKDYQQVAVIRKMVRDLRLPVEIRTGATVREVSGLAMSSRNGYLSEDQKAQAARIYTTLTAMREQLLKAAHDLPTTIAWGIEALEEAGLRVDYLEIVNSDSLQAARDRSEPLTIAVAAFLGSTRLIDNLSLSPIRDTE